MELSGERSVKSKATMEYHAPENVDTFVSAFKEECLEIEMTKQDAE